MIIKRIKHHQIDFVKWDLAIEKSSAPLIYGYAWYLNTITSNQWDALVVGDYEAVFPMPWKKKFGIKYIYQPYFCQQLGVFGPADFKFSINDFLKAIPRAYLWIDLQLNLLHGTPSKGKLRNNYQLDLKPSYTAIAANYNPDVNKNIRKVERQDIVFKWGLPALDVISINRQAWGSLNPELTDLHYKLLNDNCDIAFSKGRLLTLGAFLDGELLGAVLFFTSPGYLFYMNGGATAAGKKFGIMNSLIDEVIQRYAGQPMVLDFEGSEIEGVAYFYSKFGSEIKPYWHYQSFNLF